MAPRVCFFTVDFLGNYCSLVLPYHLPGTAFGKGSNDLGEFLALPSVCGIFSILVFVVGDLFLIHLLPLISWSRFSLILFLPP